MTRRGGRDAKGEEAGQDKRQPEMARLAAWLFQFKSVQECFNSVKWVTLRNEKHPGKA